MKPNNTSQINRLNVKTLLSMVMAIQFSILGLIGINELGFQIPILRQFVGFVYLTFIPGLLLIRVLKLDNLNTLDVLLYSVGLSISTIMFVGFLINTICPIFGISKPISIFPLVIVFSFIVFFLCYLVSRENVSQDCIILKNISNLSLDPQALFLCIVPFLAIFGTYLMNNYNNNTLLLLLIVIISTIVLFIGFRNSIKENLYPLAIYVISISLLFHNSLISMYLLGTDIHIELYSGYLVKNLGYWDPSIYGTLNGMLSIVMLAPIYSLILNMDLTWVFKIVYPIFFSLVPVGLYRLYLIQTNSKIAFFSCFFFVSVFPFYTIMLEAARQQIAELFFMLLLLVIIDQKINSLNKSILCIIFSFSLATAHYGLSYLYLFSFIFVWIILFFAESHVVKRKLRNTNRIINTNFMVLIIIFSMGWYIYVSKSSVFESLIHVINSLIGSITGSMDSSHVEALNIISANTSGLHSITKYLHLFTQLLITVGIVYVILKAVSQISCKFEARFLRTVYNLVLSRWNFLPNNFLRFVILQKNRHTAILNYITTKFTKEYLLFSVGFFGICILSLIIPETSSKMGTSRTYEICLLTLSPFFVIGFIICMSSIFKNTCSINSEKIIQNILKSLSVFLIVFFLFNSGFVYEIAHDSPTSISLNSTVNNMLRFDDGDVNGVKWFTQNRNQDYAIYADGFERFIIYEFISFSNIGLLNSETKDIYHNSYIFLGPLNVINDQIVNVEFKQAEGAVSEYSKMSNSTFYRETLVTTNKIYNNGIVNIFQ